MSGVHGYRAVGWNRQKRIYDTVMIGGVAGYLAIFLVLGGLLRPNATVETLLIRAFGTAAFLLLNLVLSIGPLTRLDRRFLPLLYNRRHLGVTTFLLAAAHGFLALFQFHFLGDVHPLVSVLTSNGRYDSLAWFPFQPLGLLALVVLFLMAATSHDFWLANLSPPTWKRLHMSVYLAYGLLVLHVAMGVLQVERSPWPVLLLVVGMVWLLGIHLLAGWREHVLDRPRALPTSDSGLADICAVGEIPEFRARIVHFGDERIAIFRYDGKISAVSNVCRHQNGPLGEGRVRNGCITCPWHGYEYRPESGSSPPPFTEKVATYRVAVRRGRVLLDPHPKPPGTFIEPARISLPGGTG